LQVRLERSSPRDRFSLPLRSAKGGEEANAPLARLFVFLLRAPGSPFVHAPIGKGERRIRGGAGCRGHDGPTDRDASRHRGGPSRRLGRRPGHGFVVTASTPFPPASRARCFLGLLRATPGGRTFQAHSRFPGRRAYPPLIGPRSIWRSVTAVRCCAEGPRLVKRGWRFGTARLGPL
jgi:hypothetical protein